MRSKFDRQLDKLNRELIEMGALCENAIDCAIRALLNHDKETADETLSIEEEINQIEKAIEGLCLKLLLQQQPVATDLRVVSAAMKMISDMERIGDQAADIAEITRFLQLAPLRKVIPVDKMANEAVRMVTNAIDSFIKRDLTLAGRVIESDDIIDDLFVSIRKYLVEYITKNPEKSENCLDMLMIAKYFERIGDHAANIAEWVEFSITGVYKGETL